MKVWGATEKKNGGRDRRMGEIVRMIRKEGSRFKGQIIYVWRYMAVSLQPPGTNKNYTFPRWYHIILFY